MVLKTARKNLLKMNKIDKYKKEFANIQKSISENNNIDKNLLINLQILQTQLLMEIVAALQVLSQQNKNNDDKLSYMQTLIKNITGEPIELIISEGINDDANN